MKNIIIFCITIFLFGCDEKRDIQTMVEIICSSKGSRKQLATFVINCSKAANPMSDEEGEDLVSQCEETGRRILCSEEIKSCRKYGRKSGFWSGWVRGSWTTDCDGVRKWVSELNGK